MAGLILKEMQARRLGERVLVVAPGHLKYQWQREMKERFGVGFRLIDRSSIRAHCGENLREEIPMGSQRDFATHLKPAVESSC